MTIQDLGALGELLGSVAVLATLVYLALQTRQNTMAISAQLDAAVITANQGVQLIGTDLAELLAKDSILKVTGDQTQLNFYCASVLTTLQWQFHQVRRGLLPTMTEAFLAQAIRGFFGLYGNFERFWEMSKAGYLPEFVEWVEEQRQKAT